GLLYFIGARVF
nr:immunoglobulin light chain junction region [Macaca mulatta]